MAFFPHKRVFSFALQKLISSWWGPGRFTLCTSTAAIVRTLPSSFSPNHQKNPLQLMRKCTPLSVGTKGFVTARYVRTKKSKFSSLSCIEIFSFGIYKGTQELNWGMHWKDHLLLSPFQGLLIQSIHEKENFIDTTEKIGSLTVKKKTISKEHKVTIILHRHHLKQQ